MIIAAADNMQILTHANHLTIQVSLKELVHELIAMHLMMEPAPLPAMLMNTPLSFAPIPTTMGNSSFFLLCLDQHSFCTLDANVAIRGGKIGGSNKLGSGSMGYGLKYI